MTTGFRLLGPFGLHGADGLEVPLGGAKQRTLLAYMVLRSGEHLPVGELIRALWGDTPPKSARKNVQLYVSRLRRIIGTSGSPARLLTTGGGYCLAAGTSVVDVHAVHELRARGGSLMRRGQADAAGLVFLDALGHWRGKPLSNLAQTILVQAEEARLDELRLGLLADRFAAQLRAGRFTEAIPELTRVLAQHPQQERFRGQLMTALWRSGQRLRALAHYVEAYRFMTEEYGLEPDRRLRELQQAILLDDGSGRGAEEELWAGSLGLEDRSGAFLSCMLGDGQCRDGAGHIVPAVAADRQ